MTAVYFVIVILALVPQVLFTVLYWKWIPAWTKNPYGRLAQLDSWSQIALFTMFLCVLTFGGDATVAERRALVAIFLLPFIFLGFFRLTLLKRAVESAKEEEHHDN